MLDTALLMDMNKSSFNASTSEWRLAITDYEKIVPNNHLKLDAH